jgi:hypothetical protein
MRGREPAWITLTEATAEDPACQVLVRPYTRLGRAAGVDMAVAASEAGGGAREANVAWVVGLAGWAVIDWKGVGDETGTPIPCTPEDVRELMLQHDAAYEAFDRLYATPGLERDLERDQEKNGSSPSPRGTSPAGAAPKAARKKTKVSPGADAATAPAAPAKAANARTAAIGRSPRPAAPSGT